MDSIYTFCVFAGQHFDSPTLHLISPGSGTFCVFQVQYFAFTNLGPGSGIRDTLRFPGTTFCIVRGQHFALSRDNILRCPGTTFCVVQGQHFASPSLRPGSGILCVFPGQHFAFSWDNISRCPGTTFCVPYFASGVLDTLLGQSSR